MNSQSTEEEKQTIIQPEEIEDILNIRTIRLASKLSLIFQRETLRPANVKVQQWRILVTLAQHGELHLRALARYSSQDPAHTSREVSAMVTKGWVSSRPDKKDQRRIQFGLTREGEKMVTTIWPHAKRFAADITELFNASESEQFKKMLDVTNAFCDDRLTAEVTE